MTWKELKEFCNQLPEEELNKNVIMWREEESIIKIEAFQLEEDHYVDEDRWVSEGCFPESEIPKDDPDLILQKVYDKGHPILQEDFFCCDD